MTSTNTEDKGEGSCGGDPPKDWDGAPVIRKYPSKEELEKFATTPGPSGFLPGFHEIVLFAVDWTRKNDAVDIEIIRAQARADGIGEAWSLLVDLIATPDMASDTELISRSNAFAEAADTIAENLMNRTPREADEDVE